MAVKNTILVGTVGYGIFRSENDGKDWVKLSVNDGLTFDLRVYYMASDPVNPQIVFAGTDQGIARSDDGGVRWQILDNALSKYSVWSLAIDPEEPEAMFAGTCPPVCSGPPMAARAGSSARWSWPQNAASAYPGSPR